MSGPPPGYNPGASTLTGGEGAAIHPVMGGGGTLPAGFENQSLLRGGEGVPIVGVQGGGAATSPLTITEAALLNVTEVIPQAFDTLLEESAKGLNDLLAAYTLKQRDGLWRRYGSKSALDVERPRILTTENCVIPSTGQLDDTRGEAGFDRLAVMLPKSTEEILLFPPVQSRRRRFYASLKYLESIGFLGADGNVTEQTKVGAKKVVIFAAPFFILDPKGVDLSVKSNRKLFAHFLKLKAQYPHMYILTQSTAMNKMIGNCIGAGASSAPLPNMLEPAYVIYPFVRMRETITDINPFDDDAPTTMGKIPVGGIIFSAAAANEATLPASNLPSKLAGPSAYLQKGERTALAYLPNTKAEEAELNRMYKAMKVRCYAGGIKGQAPGSDGPLQRQEEYTEFNPEVVRRYIVQASGKELAEQTEGVKPDQFRAAGEDELTLEDVMYTRVPLDGRIYSFRIPGPSAPGVMEDWRGLRFTQDEADFLDQLQLTPKLLEDIFKDEVEDGDVSGAIVAPSILPPERLARFMANMANGRCFTDERLLTASECQESRDFVNRVYNWYLMHDERLEELREEEEAARKRSARFRLDTAEARAREAQEAERDVQRDTDKMLQQVLDNAKMVGVDVNRPSEDYLKNPIVRVNEKGEREGEIVVPAGWQSAIVEPSQSVSNENEYTLQAIVFKRGSDEYWIGTKKFTIQTGENPTTKARELLEQLNKNYPGYYFMQDFN